MVRKLTLISALFLTSMCMMSAQSSSLVKWNPKAGVNFSDLILPQSSPNSSLIKMGWNIGLDVSYGIRWQARGGLHYFQLGSGVEVPLDTGTYMQRLAVSQLKIPLGAGFDIYRVEYFNLWAQAQAVVNITTGVRQNAEEASSSSYPGSGVSGRAGIGIDLWSVTMEINYEYGFTDLINGYTSAKNQLVNFALGLKF